MYCTNCKRDNAESATFCEFCGAPLTVGGGIKSTLRGTISTVPTGESVGVKSTMGGASTERKFVSFSDPASGTTVTGYYEKRDAIELEDEDDEDEYEYRPKSKLKIVIIITLILAIAAGVAAYFYLKNSGPESVVTNYYNAVAAGDSDGMYSCTINDYVYDDGAAKSQVYKSIEDECADTYNGMVKKFGEDFTLSTEIKKVSEYEEGDKKKISEYVEENCGVPASAIEDIKTVLVRTTLRGGDNSESDSDDIVVAKIDGKWYVGIHGPDGEVTTRDQIDSILGRETKVVSKDDLPTKKTKEK